MNTQSQKIIEINELQERGLRATVSALREFGYPSTTFEMVKESFEAVMAGEVPPHGVVGLMAEGEFKDYPEIFGTLPDRETP